MPPDRKTRILILVPPGSDESRLDPFLSRKTMELTQIGSATLALERAVKRRFDLITVALPISTMPVREFILRMRSLEEPGRRAPVILLGDGEELKQAREFSMPGVQTVGLGESDSVYRYIVSEALGVAARLAVRIPIRLEVGIEAGRTFRFCETRNISRSGILISSSRPLPLGSNFRFELTFPYTLAPLSGFAEVVRHTNSAAEGTSGFGASFLSLSEEDDVRIQSFVQNELSRMTERRSD